MMLFYISIIFEYIFIMLKTVDQPQREWRYTDHQQQRNTEDKQHPSIGIAAHHYFECSTYAGAGVYHTISSTNFCHWLLSLCHSGQGINTADISTLYLYVKSCDGRTKHELVVRTFL